MNRKIKISQDQETGTYTVSYKHDKYGVITTGKNGQEASIKFLEALLWTYLSYIYLNKIDVNLLIKEFPMHAYWQVRHHFGIPVELKDDNLYYLETIFLKDEDGEGGTIFFKELPGIIAEGDTYEEAFRNLYSLVKFHFANP